MEKWFDIPEQDDSSVICTRVRFARNWREYPFPGKMTAEQSEELVDRLCRIFKNEPADRLPASEFSYLNRMSELDKAALRERWALTKSAASGEMSAGLFITGDEKFSILINGDDHIRIQAVEKGLSMEECFSRVNAADDTIAERIEYSFDEKYGYLTSYPTNVGTGLRASVLMHLPCLSRRKDFNSLTAEMGRFGTRIRGIYGEGAENFGSLYQVSNQRTLGQTETEITDLVVKAAKELDAQERRLRKEALSKKPVAYADEVYKSYGVLKYARRLTRRDALEFLSHVLPGFRDGIVETKEPCSVYALMLGIQPANLLKNAGHPLNKEELDIARADFVRARLPEIK